MFDLHIDTENDAFQNRENFGDQAPSIELASILRELASALDLGATSGTVRDSFGNTCGSWAVRSAPDLPAAMARKVARGGSAIVG